MIPLVDLKWQSEQVRVAVHEQMLALLDSNEFILGRDVDAFEQDYEAFTGIQHCIGVANGTDALELALRALPLEAGSEVLVPVNSFVASALAVVRAGHSVRFVDVDDASQLALAEQFEEAVTPKTRVMMPVHLYGQCTLMRPIVELAQRLDLFVVEDCAQAQGARQFGTSAGAFGDVAATSFYPGKNLGGWGDGGAVLTMDGDVARRVRELRNYGSSKKYIHDSVGFNSRLDSIQAVILREKLKHLAGWNLLRQQIAEKYGMALSSVPQIDQIETLPGNDHVYHLYVVRTRMRDALANFLGAAGISTGIHYPRIIADQAAFSDHPQFRSDQFRAVRDTASTLLSLPIYPGLTSVASDYVCEAILSYHETPN